MTIMWVGVLALSVACCHLSGKIAEHRRWSIKAWIWLGVIFGPVALLVLGALPSRHGLYQEP
jgi:hypothetical protein